MLIALNRFLSQENNTYYLAANAQHESDTETGFQFALY
jgi:hypothetical protein